jgi:hypothetical protein
MAWERRSRHSLDGILACERPSRTLTSSTSRNIVSALLLDRDVIWQDSKEMASSSCLSHDKCSRTVAPTVTRCSENLARSSNAGDARARSAGKQPHPPARLRTPNPSAGASSRQVRKIRQCFDHYRQERALVRTYTLNWRLPDRALPGRTVEAQANRIFLHPASPRLGRRNCSPVLRASSILVSHLTTRARSTWSDRESDVCMQSMATESERFPG